MPASESYEVRPESLETFEPSYASNKVQNENDAIRNRISTLTSDALPWLPEGFFSCCLLIVVTPQTTGKNPLAPRVATHLSTKKPINKLAMNNRRILIAAVFHFVHPVEKDS